MSERDTLVEHGTGLCLWAIGLSAIAGPVTGVLLVGSAFLNIYRKCSAGRIRAAKKRAIAALEADSTISDRGIRAAAQLLEDYKVRISVDPRTLEDAETRGKFPDTLYDTVFADIPVPKDDGVETALRTVIREVWAELRLEDDTHKLLTQESLAYLEGTLRDVGENVEKARDEIAVVHTEVSAVRDDIAGFKKDLLAALRQDPKHAEEVKRQTRLVMQLAERYAEGSPDDFDAAYRGLERALDVAAQRSPGGNLDAEVQAIMAEVDRLNEEESLEAGTAALRRAREARKERIAAEQAAYVALLDKGIAQAVLARSVEDAVACELEKLEVEVPDRAARFDALRAVQDVWYEHGRDQGLAFDLEVSIALARTSVDLADGADQRGAGLTDLGTALATLGQRESDTARLEEAVTAYREALEEWTRDRVPLDWAMTQNNLGAALRTFGERESGTVRLEEAVTAFRAALEERTRDRVPLDWATTQNNLGNALWTLGERENGTARLEEALIAYHAALEERTHDRVPLDWAMTQNNLGNALQTLGERESDTLRLEEAVIAYRAALEECSRDHVPLDWAMTQNNLGIALAFLGAREKGTARLEEAVTAYRDALEEWTRDRLPLDWAFTQENLAILYKSWAEKVTGDDRVAQLKLALTHVDAALEVYTPDQTPYRHDQATALRARILTALNE